MMIHGYKVVSHELVIDGLGEMVKADRTCHCCLGSTPRLLKVNLEGKWETVGICPDCMVEEGLFLNYNDIVEEAQETRTMDRGRG